MKSIITTYPDFRALPKGLKKLLLTSENYFFEEARSPWSKSRHEALAIRLAKSGKGVARAGGRLPTFGGAWRN